MVRTKPKIDLKKDSSALLKLFNPKRAPDGLTPIGDTGLYRTPDEPASPLDCNRYPSSPYCGGIPLSHKPIDLSINYILDECNVGIYIEPILGFIKLPPSVIVYRKPECRIKEPGPLPQYETPVGEGDRPSVPNTTKKGCLYEITIELTYYIRFYNYDSKGNLVYGDSPSKTVYEAFIWGRLEGIELEYNPDESEDVQLYIKAPLVPNTQKIRRQRLPDGTFYQYPVENDIFIYAKDYDIIPRGYNDTGYLNENDILNYLGWVRIAKNDLYNSLQNKARKIRLSSHGVYSYGIWASPGLVYNGREAILGSRLVGGIPGVRINLIHVKEIICLDIPDKLLDPPPPPPLLPPQCCMSCCPNTNNSDALLKALLVKVNRLSEVVGTQQYEVPAIPTLTDKVDGIGQAVTGNGGIGEPVDISELVAKVNRLGDVVGVDDYQTPPVKTLSRIIEEMYNVIGVSEYDTPPTPTLTGKLDKLRDILGVDEFPASLPDSLIAKDEGFLGNLIPNEPVEIQNYAKLFEWYIKRFDEIVGQFEIGIEIKDTDPTKPGDQPTGIKLPNIAEAIGEIFTLNYQTYINSETMLNAVMRLLAEAGMDKQQNFVTYKLLQSLTDWAGFKQKDIKLPMPLLFTLGKTRYDEILKESKVDVVCVEFDDKFGLEADFIQFREAASILKANYKVKLNPYGDIKAQILKNILDTFANFKKMNKEDDEDFEKFLEEVQDGFINTTGAENTTKPYGRPYEERPKIKDLTNYTEPTTQP